MDKYFVKIYYAVIIKKHRKLKCIIISVYLCFFDFIFLLAVC
ncbi:hypothetical protein ESCAB7627_1480 [Escherichia albertii TW07627]|uniref:Uncharacterized protein n=1 Tax=Escherichia albertii (strain TW07627) TaxID=502347 RepID=A0ABC9NRC9_ESCAT|nr:hypothetical protein ESCAB7627_1480 [Escherichia albertii TW07627]